MHKDLLTPDSKCSFTLDHIVKVSVETESFVLLRYEYVGDSLVIIVEPKDFQQN